MKSQIKNQKRNDNLRKLVWNFRGQKKKEEKKSFACRSHRIWVDNFLKSLRVVFACYKSNPLTKMNIQEGNVMLKENFA